MVVEEIRFFFFWQVSILQSGADGGASDLSLSGGRLGGFWLQGAVIGDLRWRC